MHYKVYESFHSHGCVSAVLEEKKDHVTLTVYVQSKKYKMDYKYGICLKIENKKQNKMTNLLY